MVLIDSLKTLLNLLDNLDRSKISLENKTYQVREVGSGDGNLVTYITDVTFVRSQETKLDRLQAGLQRVKSGISFWSKDNELIYANEFLRNFTHKTTGYEMKPGIGRLDFLRHAVKKGLIDYGDKTPEEVHQDLMKAIDASPEGTSVEFKTNVEGYQEFWLNTAVRLESGEWMQSSDQVSQDREVPGSRNESTNCSDHRMPSRRCRRASLTQGHA